MRARGLALVTDGILVNSRFLHARAGTRIRPTTSADTRKVSPCARGDSCRMARQGQA